MINNKKLTKQFKSILSASETAKSILEAEAGKIDEKYKALAEKEKADIASQIKILETQISTYKALLPAEDDEPEVDGAGFTAEDNEPVDTAAKPAEEPAAPADSLFSAPTEPAVDDSDDTEESDEGNEESDDDSEGNDGEDNGSDEPEWPEW